MDLEKLRSRLQRALANTLPRAQARKVRVPMGGRRFLVKEERSWNPFVELRSTERRIKLTRLLRKVEKRLAEIPKPSPPPVIQDRNRVPDKPPRFPLPRRLASAPHVVRGASPAGTIGKSRRPPRYREGLFESDITRGAQAWGIRSLPQVKEDSLPEDIHSALRPLVRRK